jgi:hypothetical protein
MISLLVQWLVKLVDNHPKVVIIPLILDVLFFYGGFHLYAQASDVEYRVSSVEVVMERRDTAHTSGILANGIAAREAVRSIKSYALEQQIITMDVEASALERSERRGDLLEGDGERLDQLKARIKQVHRELEKVRTAKSSGVVSWVG